MVEPGNQPAMNFVPKGWGYEKWIVNNELYCGKLLHFVKGKKCSIHYHKLKDETFYVQSGKVIVLYSDELERIESVKTEGLFQPSPHKIPIEHLLESVVLEKGDNFYVPQGRVHQIIAHQDTELFEFSTQHFDEDSYRIIKGD